MALAATLSTVQTVPVAGMALLLGIERFMSMARGTTNMIGNGIATIIIARWDGANWEPLGLGVDREAYALAVFDDGTGPGLYVGGNFREAGDIAADKIAPRPIDPIAHLVVGAICEGSMMVARADDQPAATKRLLAELRIILDAFRAPQKSKGS